MNKLNITLKDIETLNTFARSCECQLTELVRKDESDPQSQVPPRIQGDDGIQGEQEPDMSTGTNTDKATREKLTRELQEIERER